MKTVIITGTKSISIADRAVAATMSDRVEMVVKPQDGISSAFTVANKADESEFLLKLAELKKKWKVRYKSLAGRPTTEKAADYKVLVVSWAQENGAPDFAPIEPIKSKTPKAKTTKAKTTKTKTTKAPEPNEVPEDEFGSDPKTDADPEAVKPDPEAVKPDPEAADVDEFDD